MPDGEKLDSNFEIPKLISRGLFSLIGKRNYVKVKPSIKKEMVGARCMNLKNITIIGPGALGILFTTKICQKFPHVFLIDHDRHRAGRLARKGVAVVEANGGSVLRAFPVVTADAAGLGRQDVVMVLVKAFQTDDVLDAIESLSGPETIVVTLQNGIGAGDILSRTVPRQNLVLGVTMHGANRRDESTVVHAGSGDTILGMFDPGVRPVGRLYTFAALLAECGFPASIVDDIYPVLWKKLMVNVGINPLTALSGLKNGQILEHPPLRRIQEAAVYEAFEVMRRLGIDIGMDFQGVMGLVRKVCRDTAENVSSMLQDRMKKGQTEIEYINGAVVRFARKEGLRAQVNEMLCNLIEYFTSHGWGFGPFDK